MSYTQARSSALIDHAGGSFASLNGTHFVGRFPRRRRCTCSTRHINAVASAAPIHAPTLCRSLNLDEVWDIYLYGLLGPLYFRLPEGWVVSNGGLTMPAVKEKSGEIQRAIGRHRS